MMNKRIFKYTAILFLTVLTLSSYAQDRRTLDTKIANALAQMPTNDLEHRNRVMSELADLGTDGFQKLSQLLTTPGVGDDTAVRFAINSLARYASNFGREDVRRVVEDGLLQALEVHSDAEVKTFLFNQLNLVGSNKPVSAVSKYLADDELAEPATQTLVQIGSDEAAKTIYAALPNAGDAAKTTLVRALGELK